MITNITLTTNVYMLHCEITSKGKTDIIYEVLCAKCGMTS